MTNLKSISKKPSIIFLIILLGISPTFAQTQQDPQKSLNIAQPVSGESAIAAIGDKINEIAQDYGLAASTLQKRLAEDSTLHIDNKAKLFYVDTAPPPQQGGGGGSANASSICPGYSLSDVFTLHSKPDSTKTIYLDFNGHTISGSQWNDDYNGGAAFTGLAWSLDGDRNSFTNSERVVILETWCRIAEDYAPFDVDVTTELSNEDKITRSSNADTEYGTRVFIGPKPTTSTSICTSCGGIAYLNVFDNVGTFFQPAFVFSDALFDGAKNMAEAASHEAGHNFNLFHDGTNSLSYYSGHGSGDTGWAPIMGAGYYSNLTQWGKGEYLNANNQEDDIAIISGFIPLKTDDYGNSSGTATAINFSNGAAAKSGIIERETDVDVFSLILPDGTFGSTARPENQGSNLDIKLSLRDASFALISEINPAAALNATLNTSLSSGTYYLVIENTNKGNVLVDGYNKYGVIGKYDLALTFSPTTPQAPHAVAQANSATPDVNSAVQFTGSGSYDVDGTITAYSWDFGDGATANTADASHTYSVIGNYTARLTVTDNTSDTNSQTISINVLPPNQLPTASFSLSVQSGNAPLTVNFDASSSTDGDGSIAAFAWNFGDGSSATGVTTSKVFAQAGAYDITLTVTDNRGGTATKTSSVSLSAPTPEPTQLRVKSLSLKKLRNNSYKITTIVETTSGQLASAAQVSGTWSNGRSKLKAKKSTNLNGQASFTAQVSGSGNVKFTVTGISKDGFSYNACDNLAGVLSFKIPTSRAPALKVKTSRSANCG